MCERLHVLDHICWSKSRNACKKVTPTFCFCGNFYDFGAPGASRRALGGILEAGTNFFQKIKLISHVSGAILGYFCTQIDSFFVSQFVCLLLASLLGGLRSQFWGFGGHFRVHFKVLWHIFSQMLQNFKNATFSSDMLGLGGAGAPFFHYFC